MFEAESLKKLIDEHEIISFDIFDTLLLRPYIEPIDAFLHMENHFGIKDFSQKRTLAETNARSLLPQGREDVSLEEIYEQMPDDLQKFQSVESNWELDHLFKNPEIFEIYDYALKKGKKIIIISDMYLSFELVETILHKNQYNNYQKLYLSSEVKKMKHTGSLYFFVLADLGVAPEKILHIGDNFYSDYQKANEIGIKAIYYPKLQTRLFEKDARIKKLYYSIKDADIKVDISILAMMSAVYELAESRTFWQKIGYKFAGSMVYSFAKWIEMQLIDARVDNVGFVARDGYFLNEVLKIINSQINSQYIYASRNVISNIQNDSNLLEKYKNYLEEKGLLCNEQFAFVDARTEFFSVQKFLSQFAPSCLGLYWMIGQTPNKSNYRRFYDFSFDKDEAFLMSELLEFYLSSPEKPVKTLAEENNSLKPVYFENQREEESYRIKIIEEMSSEIIKFAIDMQQILLNLPILQNPYSIILWNNVYLTEPTEEETAEFSQICHSSNKEHDNYISILKLKTNASYQMYIKALKHSAKKI